MEKHFCDECGQEIPPPGTSGKLTVTARVSTYIGSNHRILEGEFCSGKCLVSHLMGWNHFYYEGYKDE